MPKITYIVNSSNMLDESTCQAIINTVNCVGVMGKGVALAVKQRWPGIMTPYQRQCREGKMIPGIVIPWRIPGTNSYILNAATKDHWRDPSQLPWIVDILCQLTLAPWEKYGITSLAVPPLGCGNGGLEWSQVGPNMAAFLEQLPLERVEVYIPQGWEQY